MWLYTAFDSVKAVFHLFGFTLPANTQGILLGGVRLKADTICRAFVNTGTGVFLRSVRINQSLCLQLHSQGTEYRRDNNQFLHIYLFYTAKIIIFFLFLKGKSLFL